MERPWFAHGAPVEPPGPSVPLMHTFTGIAATALAAAALATPGHAGSGNSATEYSLAVTHTCAGALLFDHAHHMGTRADALSVARDIRASTARRLARVAALPAPPAEAVTVARWITVERRLADMYARNYLRIYDAISTPGTTAQHDRALRSVRGLLNAPQALREDAGRLELRLRVPDCTGG
jgi:hypothetical protein